MRQITAEKSNDYNQVFEIAGYLHHVHPTKRLTKRLTPAPCAEEQSPCATAIDQVLTDISNTVQADQIKYITVTLPKGTKVIKSTRTIITPATPETANKERWFEVKRPKSYKVENGLVTITLAKHMLGYHRRAMLDFVCCYVLVLQRARPRRGTTSWKIRQQTRHASDAMLSR
ncbi:hypothetical protein [Bradyrhizobium sp. Ash2021]|uniref:hypothetical protein n=1 Tax=Bradyrhizobium sp. Ash2021 TaxID=2954771 RepID=UPI0028150B5F|nr:hypothetical protein [Bradyrhizobium sp. Ash2021]WMT71784.1 hypothetical protein NL528_27335 [Bradyrhizobium sp. Ash2021]